jgi:di/tricarboxylate transporter
LFWQAATLLLTGLLLSPLLPDPRGRAALTGPLALAVAQAARLRDREPAAAVLGLAAWIGSGPLMFLFLSASPVCLLAWGLLPAEQRSQFDWLSWFVAALPFGALTSLGALAALFILLRPQGQSAPSRERLNLQLAVLGPPSPREVAMMAVLALTVAGWFIAPAIHVHVGVVAVFGLFAAVAAGSFDQRSLSQMDWGYLIYYGAALSIAHLAGTLGIWHIVGSGAAGWIQWPGGSLLASVGPLVFLLGVAIAGLLVRMAIEASQAILLLGLVLVPAGAAIGVNPWVVIVALLAMNNPWFTDRQTPAYAVAYSATDGRLYSHDQARKVAFGYVAVTLTALVLCVPYWRLIGLL